MLWSLKPTIWARKYKEKMFMVIERVTISALKDGRVSAEVSRGSRPRQSSRDSRWHILNLVTQRPVSSALFFTYSLNCVFWYLHIPSVVHCGPYVGASSLAQATSSEQFAMDLEPSFRWCTHSPETLEIQHDCWWMSRWLWSAYMVLVHAWVRRNWG